MVASGVPGYWMNETSGVLRPAVETYLAGEPLAPEHVAAMRAYLRLWIYAPGWAGAEELSDRVDRLTDRASISDWLNDALEIGIDPL